MQYLQQRTDLGCLPYVSSIRMKWSQRIFFFHSSGVAVNFHPGLSLFFLLNSLSYDIHCFACAGWFHSWFRVPLRLPVVQWLVLKKCTSSKHTANLTCAPESPFWNVRFLPLHFVFEIFFTAIIAQFVQHLWLLTRPPPFSLVTIYRFTRGSKWMLYCAAPSGSPSLSPPRDKLAGSRYFAWRTVVFGSRLAGSFCRER